MFSEHCVFVWIIWNQTSMELCSYQCTVPALLCFVFACQGSLKIPRKDPWSSRLRICFSWERRFPQSILKSINRLKTNCGLTHRKSATIVVWGSGGVCGTIFTRIVEKWMTRKVRIIILLQLGLITFGFHFGKPTSYRVNVFVSTTQNQLLLILETPNFSD